MVITTQKTNKKMKKFNKIVGSFLVIVSIVSCIASYFNVLLLSAITLTLAIFVCAIAMVQEYYYGSDNEYDPGVFWIIYSVIGILVGATVKCAIKLEILEDTFSQPLMMGVLIMVMPMFGVFFGMIGRMLFKSSPFIK